MNTETRDEKFDRQTSEIYEHIGRFVVEFEIVAEHLRRAIISKLCRKGLHNPELARILVSHKAMTAAPLIVCHDSVLTELDKCKKPDEIDPVQKEVLNQISKEFDCLIQERNRIVHGYFRIGNAPAGADDFSSISGYKGNPSKKAGMAFEPLPGSADELRTLVERARSLRLLLDVFNVTLPLRRALKPESKLTDLVVKEGKVWLAKHDPVLSERTADP